MQNTSTSSVAREIAATIVEQIGRGTLMSLGGHNLTHGMIATTADAPALPSLSFDARILPMTKGGHRGSTPRIMRVVVGLNGADYYDVHVSYPQRGDTFGQKPRTVHYEADDVDAGSLSRLLLALDYDGTAVLNPRLVP